MSKAPFCNVAGVQVPGTPKLPSLQPIPKATDLPSVIKAIEALTNNFNTINNWGQGTYVENRSLRTYNTVRVYDPTNPQIYVDVQQITGLTFVNPATGQQIVWKQ